MGLMKSSRSSWMLVVVVFTSLLACGLVSGFQGSGPITGLFWLDSHRMSAEVGQIDFNSYAAPTTPTPESLYTPTGVFSTTSGLYVADASSTENGYGRISFFAENTLQAMNTGATVTFGQNYLNPDGSSGDYIYVAVDSYGNVYTTDNLTSTVYKFIPPLTQGLAPTYNLGNATNIPIRNPAQVAIDPTNQRILVADTGNNRVVVFPANATASTPAIAVYGANSLTSTVCQNIDCLSSPLGVTVDCRGGVWISSLYSGLYAIYYFAPGNTTSATYLLTPPSTPTARRNDFRSVTSLSWDRNSCARLLFSASATSISASAQYILTFTFGSNGVANFPAVNATYLVTSSSGTFAAPDETTESIRVVPSAAWDAVRPGFFWDGDITTHRVTLQSYNGSFTNFSAPTPSPSPSFVNTATPSPTASRSANASVTASASTAASSLSNGTSSSSISRAVNVSVSINPTNLTSTTSSLTPASNISVSTSASVTPSVSSTVSLSNTASVTPSVSGSVSGSVSFTPSITSSVSFSNSPNPLFVNSSTPSTSFSSTTSMSSSTSFSSTTSISLSASASIPASLSSSPSIGQSLSSTPSGSITQNPIQSSPNNPTTSTGGAGSCRYSWLSHIF
eukprot:TRINITY_DN3214_c1_g1_i1.p1 TRINITY_DN3214_c1_g1~~TRINITY_DN3214_c1_g1_i1.p1  ORF type:complete len:621 (-),score=160.10 TRINITY_DN3214_c1_g1_i1:84-1946(-)